MASTKKSNHVKGLIPTPTPIGKETITVSETISLATTDIDLADVIQGLILPAGCVPVGYSISVSDMDTGTAILAADFGILTSAETAISTASADGGAKWLAAMAWSAASLALHTASRTTYDILKVAAATSADRIVGFVISTAATTAAAGTVTLELSYKAVN